MMGDCSSWRKYLVSKAQYALSVFLRTGKRTALFQLFGIISLSIFTFLEDKVRRWIIFEDFGLKTILSRSFIFGAAIIWLDERFVMSGRIDGASWLNLASKDSLKIGTNKYENNKKKTDF